MSYPALRTDVACGAVVVGGLRGVRRLFVRGAHRPQRVALLAGAPRRARRVPLAARGGAGAAATVARARWLDRRARGDGAARALRAGGDVHGGLGPDARRHRRGPPRTPPPWAPVPAQVISH